MQTRIRFWYREIGVTMPWNEPGQNGNNGKDHDPWKGNGNQNPPNLDKLFGDLIKKIRGIFAQNNKSNTSWGKIPKHSEYHYGLGAVLAIFLVLWFIAGLFIVNPAEEAVILRFGKYSDSLQPGLHWIPRFIDTKYLVDVRKIFSFSIHGDYLTKSSDQNDLPNQYIQINTKTSDQSKNLVNVELNVQYRINDPRAYLFNVVNPDDTVQQVAAGAVSDVIGKMKLDEVLTTGRELLSAGVLQRTRDVLKNYNAGIEVLSVTLRKIQAPDQVRTAFSDVNRADQEKATYIQQAQAYASKIVPLAQGVAARIRADANAYQQQAVLTAQASVAKYQALARAYAEHPDVTRERMYLETLQNVFTHTTKILVDFNNSNNMLYLPIDKLLKNDAENASQGATPSNLHSTLPLAAQNDLALNLNPSAINGGGVKNVSN